MARASLILDVEFEHGEVSAAPTGKRKPRLSGALTESRRADSNRGPLHYE